NQSETPSSLPTSAESSCRVTLPAMALLLRTYETGARARGDAGEVLVADAAVLRRQAHRVGSGLYVHRQVPHQRVSLVGGEPDEVVAADRHGRCLRFAVGVRRELAERAGNHCLEAASALRLVAAVADVARREQFFDRWSSGSRDEAGFDETGVGILRSDEDSSSRRWGGKPAVDHVADRELQRALSHV